MRIQDFGLGWHTFCDAIRTMQTKDLFSSGIYDFPCLRAPKFQPKS